MIVDCEKLKRRLKLSLLSHLNSLLLTIADASDLTNGYLDTPIDWIPGMDNIRLKDFPTFIRTTDPNDFMVEFVTTECERAKQASAIVLNTFDALESRVLDTLNTMLPPVYSIGPLHLLENQVVFSVKM